MNDDIDDIDEIEAVLPRSETKTAPVHDDDRGVGLKTVLASSAIAALLGISGGTYFGGLAGQSGQSASIDYSQDIETVNKSVGTLTAKLERIERQIKDIDRQSSDAITEIPDLSTLLTRLDALEAAPEDIIDVSALTNRLDTLEAAAFEPKTLKGLRAIEKRLGALEAVEVVTTTAAVSDNPEYETSLTALETDISDRLTALESVEMPQIETVDLTPIETRISELETRLNAIPVALPSFPREAVLEALEAAKSSEDKGWIARTFGDQVVVQNADILARLDRIESNVARQDIKAIEKDVASLPQGAQKALEPWLAKVQKTGNTP